MVTSGHSDHVGSHIDPLYAASPLGQITAHSTSAAPRIENPGVVHGRHRINERIDQGEVDGSLGAGVRQVVGVILRQGVVAWRTLWRSSGSSMA
ncbi:MAG: hypothetical protein QOF53_2145 [Nocardioidaceae bacterium]|nr:hypothetical protein [Nocardioidaceae bacterium]